MSFRISLLLLAFGLTALGCGRDVHVEYDRHGDRRAPDAYKSERKGGPPPWAPAHGYRKKMRYRYYPDAEVYYEPGKGEYVWIEAGEWRVGRRLPDHIDLDLGDYIEVDIEGDHPELYHRQIRESHPPGDRNGNHPGRGGKPGKRNY